MKKFALLVLTALLFAGCNNMLTNPDAFSVEEASVSMDISQLKARVATDGDIITSTLDFVGDEPKHSPFEKTQTINGSTINYTIKGLPVGSSVQFKLSVYKNGIVIFEGTSDKTTVKSKTDLKISLDKQSNWVVLRNYAKLGDRLALFDINFMNIKNDVAEENEINLGGYIYTSTTDEHDNLYAFTYFNEQYCLVRYAFPYKSDPVILRNLDIKDYNYLGFDSATDSLYYFYYESVEGGINSFLVIPNASTYTIDDDSATTINVTFNSSILGNYADYINRLSWSIYNGEFYWIEKNISGSEVKYNNICKINKIPIKSTATEDDVQSVTLYSDDQEARGVIGGSISSSLGTSTINGQEIPIYHATVTDFTVTDEGVFVLLSDTSTYNPDIISSQYTRLSTDSYNSSRGGVIKMNHDFTKAELKGWTESKSVISSTNSNTTDNLSIYRPKNGSQGLFGPLKIYAVKPKKLIFLDRGEWAYVDAGKNLVPTFGQRLVIFDLETCSYSSVNVPEEDFFASEFKDNVFSQYNGWYTPNTLATNSETWE